MAVHARGASRESSPWKNEQNTNTTADNLVVTALAIGLALLGGAVVSSACIVDPTQSQCASCLPGEDVYRCKIGSDEIPVCGTDEVDANYECETIQGGTFNGLKSTCEPQGTDGETGASGWDPGSNVSYDPTRGAYIVDETFFLSVLDEPDQLLFDSARLEEQSNGTFKFASIATGDLADELGFQNGDTLVSINRYSLSTWENMWQTYVDLDDDGATEFEVKVTRPGPAGPTTVTINYIVE